MSEDANRTDASPVEDRWASLWRRVNEHKLVQWTVAYVALAYGIQHGVTLTSEAFEWPHAVERVTMLLLALGLPLAITLAWYHGHRASRRISGPELSIISILLVIGAGLFYVFARPSEQLAAAPAPLVTAQAVGGTPAGISVAVLPFVNLSSDKEQEFFSDGMTEEITSALAKIPNLPVVGRTSAFAFKGQNKDLRAIGQALSATHLIEGSVRKDGNEVRITAQLIRADNGTHLWTESYDRELKGVFAIQEEIATAIASALRVPLGLQQGKSLVSNRTNDTASYQDYLRAKALVRLRGQKPLADAAALLEQVVARDPSYAPAWALLSLAYGVMPNYHPAWYSGAVAETRRIVDASQPRAEAAAKRAIQLDPKNADGYKALGVVEAQRAKLLMAEELYSKALALDPNNADTLHQYSQLLAEVGRLKEAIAMRQRLQTLEPLLPVYNLVNAQLLWIGGQNDAPIAILKELPADFVLGKIFLAMEYASAGRYGEAAGSLAETPMGAFLPGTVDDAVRLLRTAPAAAVASQSLPRLGDLEFVYLHVGGQSRVLEFEEGNIEAGYTVPITVAILWHASYAPVRKTERFRSVVRKAGLVDYWRAKGWPDLCHPVGADDFVCE